MHDVYILRLKNNRYYTGFSSDLQARLSEHQKGKVRQTKNFRRLKLHFYAAFESKIKALRFEKYLKSSFGHAFRNKRLI